MPKAINQGNGTHAVTREVRSGYPFVVLHAGNLGFYGAWATVVKAARMLNGDGVGFVFVGDGAARSHVETSAEGCNAIRFQPYRPADQVPYVLAAGDIHLLTIRRGLEGVVVPSKLYPICLLYTSHLRVNGIEESDFANSVPDVEIDGRAPFDALVARTDGNVIGPANAVSYTHLDVYKRQGLNTLLRDPRRQHELPTRQWAGQHD